jgi:hypothetical protein
MVQELAEPAMLTVIEFRSQCVTFKTEGGLAAARDEKTPKIGFHPENR